MDKKTFNSVISKAFDGISDVIVDKNEFVTFFKYFSEMIQVCYKTILEDSFLKYGNNSSSRDDYVYKIFNQLIDSTLIEMTRLKNTFKNPDYLFWLSDKRGFGFIANSVIKPESIDDYVKRVESDTKTEKNKEDYDKEEHNFEGIKITVRKQFSNPKKSSCKNDYCMFFDDCPNAIIQFNKFDESVKPLCVTSFLNSLDNVSTKKFATPTELGIAQKYGKFDEFFFKLKVLKKSIFPISLKDLRYYLKTKNPDKYEQKYTLAYNQVIQEETSKTKYVVECKPCKTFLELNNHSYKQGFLALLNKYIDKKSK